MFPKFFKNFGGRKMAVTGASKEAYWWRIFQWEQYKGSKNIFPFGT